MNKDSLSPNDSIVFSGKIGEVIHTAKSDGRVFERYRRPPGTRLVIISPDKKILVTKEYRHETGSYDLRLPGGKVCDTIDSYHALLDSGRDITDAAREAATKEALEETGLIVHDLTLLTKANSGATVEWDLYYFKVDRYETSPGGQQLEHGEDIEVTWLTVDEIKQEIAAGHMNEWRSVGVLLGMVIPELS